MSKLLILQGVPASGKSTYALKLQAEGYTRINRDDIRFALYGQYWGGSVDEEVVTQVENAALEGALSRGADVVLDATNLNHKHLRTKLSIASLYGAEVGFLPFAIGYEQAVWRDSKRERQVGAKVIADMFKRYKINTLDGLLPKPPEPLPKFEAYFPNPALPNAYIVDTDGTVAEGEGVRSPHDTSRYHLDKVRTHVAYVADSIAEYGVEVVGLSGRDEKFRAVTEKWWNDNRIAYSAFFMRPRGDVRMDAIVKYELFKEHIEPNYNVLGAFDDRPQVIRMWRTIGVPVFDVGNGVEF